jgi:hypothetical protein
MFCATQYNAGLTQYNIQYNSAFTPVFDACDFVAPTVNVLMTDISATFTYSFVNNPFNAGQPLKLYYGTNSGGSTSYSSYASTDVGGGSYSLSGLVPGGTQPYYFYMQKGYIRSPTITALTAYNPTATLITGGANISYTISTYYGLSVYGSTLYYGTYYGSTENNYTINTPLYLGNIPLTTLASNAVYYYYTKILYSYQVFQYSDMNRNFTTQSPITATVTPGNNQFTFTSSGSYTVNTNVYIYFLVVAGGGGGGQNGDRTGGGGGAGGYIINKDGVNCVPGTYNVIVGTGGVVNTSGSNSVIYVNDVSYTAYGGGAGGSNNNLPSTGGSGGGGRHSQRTGANGTVGQGNAGGGGYDNGNNIFSGAGGGGGSTVGQDGRSISANGGNGGSGILVTSTSSDTYYLPKINNNLALCGGGGGGAQSTNGSATQGNGGNGGGGKGAYYGGISGGDNGTSGQANTGGGGGGAAYIINNGGTKNAGSGGSGLVIITYN